MDKPPDEEKSPPNTHTKGERLNTESVEKIKAAITERKAIFPCPRCGKAEFFIHDQISKLNGQGAGQALELGGPTIPCAMLICKHCGFLSLHSVGVLGFLETDGRYKGLESS